jgi:arginyl-tRNA synthetase
MNFEADLHKSIKDCVLLLYQADIDDKLIQIQETRKEFKGDFTLVVFPLLKISKSNPEKTATDIGNFLKEQTSIISEFNVVKGFLNISLDERNWIDFLNKTHNKENYGIVSDKSNPETVLIEYSSPNTNKPLHLGHIRNNLLGYSVANIIESQGDKVIKVNLVNDRGIHICKSMLAWQKWGNNITPEGASKKGDHLVGDFYVKFDQEYKKRN